MAGSFADVPIEVIRRVRLGERVVLIVLDALGLEFLRRHSDHPLVERLEVTPLSSQFPSTTTANITTVHFALPVEEHGLYEWNILEPALEQIICPLRFTLAGAEVSGLLAGHLDPDVLSPGPTLYEQLGRGAAVWHPRAIEPSHFTRLATRGATVHGFDELEDGAREAFARAREHPYTFIYWDQIDAMGHVHGPSSEDFHESSRSALDALWHVLRDLDGGGELTVLVTADHGQVDVSPERLDYLDDLWPELAGQLSQPRPAGSSRDLFLHVRAGHENVVIEELQARLGERASVRPAVELFATPSPRLLERLGQVAVLPAAGRQVWLRQAIANEQWFKGQHGGLEAAETDTYLARFSNDR